MTTNAVKATAAVLKEVAAERKRQDNRWGQPHQPLLHRLAILAEEFGEVAKEVVEAQSTIDRRTDDEAAHYYTSLINLRAELVQLAAVAVANIEVLDRAT